MGAGLGASSGAYVQSYLVPIFSEELQALQKLVMLLVGPLSFIDSLPEMFFFFVFFVLIGLKFRASILLAYKA